MGQVSLLQYHTPHAKPPCLIRRGEGGVHDTRMHDTRARVLLTLSCVCMYTSHVLCVVSLGWRCVGRRGWLTQMQHLGMR